MIAVRPVSDAGAPEAARCHVGIAVEETSQVGEARRAATAMARAASLDENDAGRVALVVSELATNLARYARQGRILLRPLRDGVEILSIDVGPGMDVSRSLRDGESSQASLGQGLGAVARTSDAFEAWSEPSVGTLLWCQVRRTERRRPSDSGFTFGGVSLPLPSETECGDGWMVHVQGTRALVAVVDGLGHGPVAALAASTFLAAVARRVDEPPASLLTAVHLAMRATRGAAAAIVALDRGSRTATMAGIGNISVEIIDAAGRSHGCVSQHGILGAQMRTLRDQVHPFPAGATLLLTSDGVQSRWRTDVVRPLLVAHPALLAMAAVRLGMRRRDDATAVAVRDVP